MRILYFTLWLLVAASIPCSTHAQNECTTEDGCKLYQQAQAALRVQSYASAINLLRLSLSTEPTNVVFHRELSRAYLLNNEKSLAAFFIEKAMQLPTVDEATFVTASNIYSQISQFELARKAINRGLEVFPKSGLLYEAKGTLYYVFEKDKEAIKYWQQGVKEAPHYSGNYYQLAKQEVAVNENIVRAILYAETFVLMEPFSSRATEMKKVMFDAYKSMFNSFYTATNIKAAISGSRTSVAKGSLQHALCTVYENNRHMLVGGVTDNNIIMFRMRFLLDWSTSGNKAKFPLKLIEHLQTIVAEGHFEAYNRWLFGEQINPDRYKRWCSENASTHQYFMNYIATNKLIPTNEQSYFK